MLSTWDHNNYRKNEYIESVWNDCIKITHDHFYYVGAKQANRNPVTEALLTNYTKVGQQSEILFKNEQMTTLNKE